MQDPIQTFVGLRSSSASKWRNMAKRFGNEPIALYRIAFCRAKMVFQTSEVRKSSIGRSRAGNFEGYSAAIPTGVSFAVWV